MQETVRISDLKKGFISTSLVSNECTMTNASDQTHVNQQNVIVFS